MKTMQIVFITLAATELFYAATVLFVRFEDKKLHNSIQKELAANRISFNLATFNKFVQKPHTFAFSSKRYAFSTVANVPSLVFFFLLLPIMVWTIVSVFLHSSTDFTFSFPEGSFFTVITTFSIAALVHELGHYYHAFLNGANVEGFGFGLTYGLPHFCIVVDEDPLLHKEQRNIALGGCSFNLLLAALSIGLAWLTSLSLKQGVSSQFGAISELNGQEISSINDFNRTLSAMKQEFFKQRYLLDTQNSFNSPVHRKLVPSFGALRIPLNKNVEYKVLEEQDSVIPVEGTGLLFLLNEELVNNEFIKILKPITVQGDVKEILSEAMESEQFCSSSDSQSICVLPIDSYGDVGIFMPAQVDGVAETIQTSFKELEESRLVQGGNGYKQSVFINNVINWFSYLASASVGVGLVSLLVIPQSSDGCKVLESFEVKMRAKIGVFSQLVSSFVKGVSVVVFLSMIGILLLKGLVGI